MNQVNATGQLHMRKFKDGDHITIEPFRANAFPVVRDLVVDRSAFDRIIAAGGYAANEHVFIDVDDGTPFTSKVVQIINDGGATNPNLDRGPGTSNWLQAWYRDPANGPGQDGSALTDAVEVTYQ